MSSPVVNIWTYCYTVLSIKMFCFHQAHTNLLKSRNMQFTCVVVFASVPDMMGSQSIRYKSSFLVGWKNMCNETHKIEISLNEFRNKI